jgi:hypothetical protein
MKKPENMVREYVRRLSDEDLKFINGRLNQRLSNDLSEVLNYLSRANEMDRWLASAKGASELYDMVDMVHSFVEKEGGRRYNNK